MMYPEERRFYELTLSTLEIPQCVVDLHEQVSALVHKIHAGQLNPQTMAVIATLAKMEQARAAKQETVVKRGRPPTARASRAK